MQPEKILQSDSLDILFEHRNKLYGAYQLRKKYNKRLLIAMALGLLVISIPTVYVILKKADIISPKKEYITELFVLPTVNLEKPEPKPKKVLPAAPILKKQKQVASNTSGRVEIVKDVFAAKKSEINQVTLNPIPGITGTAIIAPTMAGNSNVIPKGLEDPVVSIPDPNIALPVAEQMPAYPGGLKALRKFLENNLESPRALEEGEKINVQVKFIVGYDGNLKSFELVKDGGTLFNKEVMRVLKLMPRWIPGKNAGKNVSVYFSLPVSFVAPD